MGFLGVFYAGWYVGSTQPLRSPLKRLKTPLKLIFKTDPPPKNRAGGIFFKFYLKIHSF